MPKAKTRLELPDTVYVQQVTDGDDSYLVAYEDVNAIDLDNGNVVGVYTLGKFVSVSVPPRVVAEV